MRTNRHTRDELIAFGEKAVSDVKKLDTPELQELSIERRFSLINTIKNGLYATFPAPEEEPTQPIDRNPLSETHIAVLYRLENSLSLSQNYQDFVLTITQRAAEDFVSRIQDVQKLLNWQHLDKAEKLDVIQNFHNAVIGYAKLELEKNKANMGLSSTARPLTVQEFIDEPTMFDDEHETSFDGYAALSHDQWPGVQEIAMNTHDRSGFRSAIEAIETIAHESAHVIEGYLAYTFGHHAQFVPDKLTMDAKMLYHMYDQDAYVMGRLPMIYERQANEKMATAAGTIAAQIVSETMHKLQPSL